MIVALVGLFAPASARAQFQPRPVSDPATGERFHIEGSIGLWFPAPRCRSRARRSRSSGRTIDFKTDLGLEDQTFPEFHLVAKGGGTNFDCSSSRSSTSRARRFTGRSCSTASLCRRRAGQLAAGLEGVADRLRVRLRPPGPRVRRVHPGCQVHRRQRVAREPDVDRNSRSAQAPIPTIGGIFRVYLVPNIAITGEITDSRSGSRPIRDDERPLRGHRLLRHGELHEQRRRAGRLPGFDVGYT